MRSVVLALLLAACSGSEPAAGTAPATHAESHAAKASANPSAKPSAKPSDVSALTPQTSPTGLTWYVLQEGTGPQPTSGQTVAVHYSGWLTDGTPFDSSLDRGRPITFPVGTGRVIKGWDEAVLSMKVGEKRQLHIPPEIGYGERGFPPVIPANATLVFDVELVKVK